MTILSFFSYNLPSTTHTQVCKSLHVHKGWLGTTTFWRRAKFLRSPHHAMFGSDTITCTEHGNWTQLPECRGESNDAATQSRERRASLPKRTADSALQRVLNALAYRGSCPVPSEGTRMRETWLLTQGDERRCQWTVWSSLGELLAEGRGGQSRHATGGVFQEEGQGRTGREHGQLDVTVRLGKRCLGLTWEVQRD